MVFQFVIHVLIPRVDVHLDAIPRRIIILERSSGFRDLSFFQGGDSVHQGWPNSLDAGNLEAFFAGGSASGLPRMADTTRGCQQSEADEASNFHHGRNSFRSEEHTSELQSRGHLVCRLLLEKKK